MSDNTITGFKVEMSSDELKTHFQVRLSHHEKALAKLKGSGLILVGQDSTEDTSELVGKHKVQARLLKFLVEHMPVNATFRLTLNELESLYVLDELTNV